MLLKMLEDGRIQLAGISVLKKHLTDANYENVWIEPLTRPNVRSKSSWPSWRRSLMFRPRFESGRNGIADFEPLKSHSSTQLLCRIRHSNCVRDEFVEDLL